MGAIDAVLVDDGGDFVFEGAIRVGEARAIWTWLSRDAAADLIAPLAAADEAKGAAAVAALAPELLVRARAAIEAAGGERDAERRLLGQLGGSEVRQRLPVVLNALRCAPLLEKAKAFGRAINALQEDDALVAALQSMPRQDTGVAALLMVAAVGQVAAPARLIVTATRIAGGASETALLRDGFGPLVDAFLAHAQNAIPPLRQAGAFVDVDLACRAIERFHRLVRSISANLELTRQSRLSTTIAALTKTVSDKIEPKLRDIIPDINQSMRRPREGADRLDSDGLLAALNGFYLLATVRDCRDSLALNEVFDDTWNRAGQALEQHLTRNMELLRGNPGDRIIAARVDAGIKMGEVRFGTEYAEVLRRARDGLERRSSLG
ncbi:MAG: hypothetical protein P4M09_26285 [Devosia sp.]|nr:hypothetical protein [Devosia sp.]